MKQQNTYLWNQRVIETSKIRVQKGMIAYLFDACKQALVSSRGYSFRK